MLNWATSPHVKRLNMAFVLIDEKLADLSERLTGNPHVASIEVPLPDEAERERFIDVTVDAATLSQFSDYDAARAGRADRRHLADRPQRPRAVGARRRAPARRRRCSAR